MTIDSVPVARSSHDGRGVAHVMRTYGVHGGERQLGQYFSAADGDVSAFIFLYRDQDCRRHFTNRTTIALAELLPIEIRPRRTPWGELVFLLALLPILQIRFLLFMKRGRYRICVVHGFQAAVTAWLSACLLRSTKFVYLHRGTKSAIGKFPLFRLLYRSFSAVAAVSHASAQSLASLTPGRQPRVIENGIDWQTVARLAADCRVHRSPHEALVLASIGRLMSGKGQQLLLQAFAEFRRVVPESELWLVGEGPDRARLESTADVLGMGRAIRFLGTRNDVSCLLGKTDIFVYASESEGLSNAVLEAMAAGLPSVVVDAPGVTECHEPGVTGFVVERSVRAMVESLTTLAGDPALRERMGAAARERVKNHYSVEANRLRYSQLYKELDALN